MFNQALKRIMGLLPKKTWARETLTSHTPDIMELETKGFHLLFVSDEMMWGHRKHITLLNEYSVCLCAAFTQNEYTSILHKLGDSSYPIAFKENITGVKQARIKGELFGVRSSQFISLDNYKANGVEFIRERIKILIPHTDLSEGSDEGHRIVHPEDVDVGSAFFYRGNYEYYSDLLDGGYSFCPVNIYKDHRDWLKEFSYFTQEEYNKK